MLPLFVYGTLQPERENAHILNEIGGTWQAATVQGIYYPRGWGAAADFPGIVLDPHGDSVPGFLFNSDNLVNHWSSLDEFEDGYDRVTVIAVTDEGREVTAWIYQLQPQEQG